MSADALFDLDPAQVRMDDLAEDLSADRRQPRRKADRLARELSETGQRPRDRPSRPRRPACPPCRSRAGPVAGRSRTPGASTPRSR